MSKIFIIEDEEAIADLEKDYLELSGFEVEVENDGNAGLKKALEEDFDLLILDLMLPGIDGFEICRKVRDQKNVPIIMVEYSGGNNYDPTLNELLNGHEIIPVCPEVMGGLSVPRIPCEILGDKVIGKDGNDYTYHYQLGAEKALEIAKKENVSLAILKKRSPSCGASLVYDGTFTKRLVIKDGIFARELKKLNVLILEA